LDDIAGVGDTRATMQCSKASHKPLANWPAIQATHYSREKHYWRVISRGILSFKIVPTQLVTIDGKMQDIKK
jgi:hypothetical protein